MERMMLDDLDGWSGSFLMLWEVQDGCSWADFGWFDSDFLDDLCSRQFPCFWCWIFLIFAQQILITSFARDICMREKDEYALHSSIPVFAWAQLWSWMSIDMSRLLAVGNQKHSSPFQWEALLALSMRSTPCSFNEQHSWPFVLLRRSTPRPFDEKYSSL